MSEPRDPRLQPADDGELVSAYLDGELDAEAAAAFEARLTTEPALAAALERTRQVVETLASLQAAPPPGYAQRLQARLAAEHDTVSLDAARAARAGTAAVGTHAAGVHAAPARSDRPAGSGPGRHDRAGHGSRTGRRRGWTPVGAVAGVLLVALLGGVTVLGTFRGAGDEMASDAAGRLSAADDGDAAGSAELFADDAAADMDDAEHGPVEEQADPSGDDEVTEDEAPAPGIASGGQPALVEAGTVLGSEDEARAHLEGVAAAGGVMGLELQVADELALGYRVAIQRAEPFGSGVEPDLCLDDAVAGAEGPAVPVAVEDLVYEERPSLAYLVVTASAGADRLDRVEARVISTEGCLTRLYLDVTPGR